MHVALGRRTVNAWNGFSGNGFPDVMLQSGASDDVSLGKTHPVVVTHASINSFTRQFA